MTVNTQIKKLEENKFELEIEVPIETFKKSIGQAYRQLSNKAKIPGFRAGKVPAKIIDSYYGKDYVLQQALEDGLPGYYSQAVHDSDIRPIDKPNIEIVNLAENKDLKFKAQVEVEPEIKLPDYKQIKVEKKKEKVKKEDIQAQLDTIRNRFAELEPTKNKVAEKGDHLLVNFNGTIDGQTFEGSSAQNFMLELGSKTFIAEFEEALIGSKAGDIKNITVIIPPNSPNKDIAGKKADFKVLVKEIKVKKLPELDGKFVKETTGFETLDALKKEIKDDLQKSLDKEAEDQYRLALLQQLAEKSKVNIPAKMVDDTVDEMVHEFEHSLAGQGSNLDNYLKATKSTLEDMKKELRKSAEERTKQQLTLRALIEKEKISVEDKDMDKAVEDFSASLKQGLSRKELEEKGVISYLKSNILYKNALDFLAKKIASY